MPNSRNSALARQTSCRCPTLRFSPPSDTAWSRPSGSELTYSLTVDLFIQFGRLVFKFRKKEEFQYISNLMGPA